MAAFLRCLLVALAMAALHDVSADEQMQHQEEEEEMHDSAEEAKQLMEEADVNKDGKVSMDEVLHVFFGPEEEDAVERDAVEVEELKREKERFTKLFPKSDLDGDNLLNLDELSHFFTAMADRHEVHDEA